MNSLNSAPWRKSSYSGNNGGDCVEVATWRKASYSGNNGGNCVEVANWRKISHSTNDGSNCVEAGVAARGHVLIRDTTNRKGAFLDIPAAAWDRFTAALK
jgi:hypothetical protein